MPARAALGAALLAGTLGLPAAACAETWGVKANGLDLPRVVLETPVRVGRGRVAITLGRGGRASRPAVAVRRTSPPSRRTSPRPSAIPAVITAPAGADESCVDRLRARAVPFRLAAATRGISTPIEIVGPIGGVRLLARAGRPPLMDCELAHALADAAPLFRRHGVHGLSFSGAYTYRNVKGTQRLSGHAHGLAIDVHALESNLGRIDVERDFPRDAHRWRGTREPASCLGHPAGQAARVVRGVACELRAHSSFRLIIGPDDNYDHRNHLHLETYPPRSRELYGSNGGSGSAHQGRRSRRR